MSVPRTCPRCGSTLSADTAEGLCPVCLLEEGLEPASGSNEPVCGSLGRPGTRIRYFGDYELLEEVGRGGMGVVFRARQVSLNRLVALKLVQGGEFASRHYVRRFRTEAEAAARLQHPGIVAIHEVGEHEGQHYFSMDYVEGPTLEEQVRNGLLGSKRAAALVQALAEAIHYAHEQGILHRDLKPSNILIDRLGHPRITDFGLAKVLTDKAGLTLSGQPMGSPGYMAPEQAAGKVSAAGPGSDVYALGAVLYHALTGRASFQAETLTEVLRQVREADPLRPRAFNSSVSPDLETICLKCLEKEPARRYPSAQELAEELKRFTEGKPILARPVNRPERLWRRCQSDAIATLGTHKRGAGAIAFSPDGRWLVSGGEDGRMTIWDLASDPVGAPITHAVESGVSALAFSPDGRRLAVGKLRGASAVGHDRLAPGEQARRDAGSRC